MRHLNVTDARPDSIVAPPDSIAPVDHVRLGTTVLLDRQALSSYLVDQGRIVLLGLGNPCFVKQARFCLTRPDGSSLNARIVLLVSESCCH